MCVKVSGTCSIPNERQLTLTLDSIRVGSDLGLLRSLSFLLASDQGIVEEAGATVRGGLGSAGGERSPCPAAAGVFGPSGKWPLLEQRVARGRDV